MSDESLAARLSGYVSRLFAPEDELLEELRREIERQELPEIYISAEVGRLLQVLLVSIGARRVLEIGTLGGYSAIWMARALPPGGELITLERDERHGDFARRFIERAGLADVVEVVVGDARDLLPGMVGAGAEPFDASFIDADKESYVAYLDRSLELVRPGGLIIADNAFRDGRVLEDDPDEATRGILEYNERVARHPGLVSTVLPVRDGVAVSVVQAAD